VLSHPTTPSNAKQLEGAEIAARALGIEIQPVSVREPNDFDSAFEAARGTDGLLLLDIALFTTHRDRLVGLAATSRLPAIYGYREMVEAGGLMSYGVSFSDMYRRAAAYVDKILKGVNPADLPVEEPTRFEFVINIRAAEALGLAIPRSPMTVADNVIE
jgi:putative ABC transport system substrate-binding protein